MAAVEFSARALTDIDRLTDFLLEDQPHEAARTVTLIVDAIDILREHPLIGRPAEQDLRELVISRGDSGYLALYTYDEASPTTKRRTACSSTRSATSAKRVTSERLGPPRARRRVRATHFPSTLHIPPPEEHARRCSRNAQGFQHRTYSSR